MNKWEKRIHRDAKRLQYETGVSYKRARRVSRECYNFLEEIKRLEKKETS